MNTMSLYNTTHVYNIYSNKISDIVAHIEVYEHDLPVKIMAQIAELFQNVALAENIGNNKTTTSELKKQVSLFLQESTDKIVDSLYLYAICLFVKQIKKYQQIFHKYHYKGINVFDRPLYKILKKQECKIRKELNRILKKHYKEKCFLTICYSPLYIRLIYFLKYIQITIFPFLNTMKYSKYMPRDQFDINYTLNQDIEALYKETKLLLNIYEKMMPVVLKNGPKQSVPYTIFIIIASWIIPILAGIPIICQFLQHINLI